jgi:hypothetical protein
MKKTELITGIIAIIGIILNFMFVVGGVALTVVSLSFLSCIYFYFGFALFNNIGFRKMFKKVSYDGKTAIRMIGAVATGFVLSMLIIGIMFKINMWIGSQAMLTTSVLPLIIITIIAIVKYIITKASYYKAILIRLAIYGSLGIAFLFITNENIVAFKYRNHPAYIEAFKNYLTDPHNAELLDKLDAERKKVYEAERR